MMLGNSANIRLGEFGRLVNSNTLFILARFKGLNSKLIAARRKFRCTIGSKINSTPNVITCPFPSYICSILAVANLLAHNNITISYYVEVNSLRLKSSVTSKWASKHHWG